VFPQNSTDDPSWASVILLLDWYNADGFPAAIDMDSDFFDGVGKVNIWRASFSSSGSILSSMFTTSGLSTPNGLAGLDLNLRLENILDTAGWEVAASTDFNIHDSDFTFEYWISIPSTMKAGVTLIDTWPLKIITGGSTGAITLYLQAKLETGFTQNFSSFTSPIGAMFHIAITRKNGGDVRVYLDGVQVSSGTLISPLESVDAGDLYKTYIFSARYTNVFYRALRLRRGVCHYPDGVSFTPPDASAATVTTTATAIRA
jgi:hypothetical protein